MTSSQIANEATPGHGPKNNPSPDEAAMRQRLPHGQGQAMDSQQREHPDSERQVTQKVHRQAKQKDARRGQMIRAIQRPEPDAAQGDSGQQRRLFGNAQRRLRQQHQQDGDAARNADP
ncbi:MAG TPA: hypothetical protein VGC82_01775 [Rhodopila sp.]